ncbi:hypothetical protein ACFP1I_32340 [Dyadobacter subterraneus]|uniref:Uncharacterized protein n=1 Tax=Dyadobacter subterraneus TaxID=2773304 RepID=A0ABR9WE06_9BACT|nr:hypothetical protein [Dyadobacter subterraneus]MBE9463710.1 hypothetical protein [Dyadobacter subterraneus]
MKRIARKENNNNRNKSQSEAESYFIFYSMRDGHTRDDSQANKNIGISFNQYESVLSAVQQALFWTHSYLITMRHFAFAILGKQSFAMMSAICSLMRFLPVCA